jgi:hypothetical protein
MAIAISWMSCKWGAMGTAMHTLTAMAMVMRMAMTIHTGMIKGMGKRTAMLMLRRAVRLAC